MFVSVMLTLAVLAFIVATVAVSALALKLLVGLLLLPFRLLAWILSLPFLLLGWILWIPFLLLKLAVGLILGLIVAPVLAIVGLIVGGVVFAAFVATVVIPLLPLVAIGVVLWLLYRASASPAPVCRWPGVTGEIAPQAISRKP
jgi:hypothetical protein